MNARVIAVFFLAVSISLSLVLAAGASSAADSAVADLDVMSEGGTQRVPCTEPRVRAIVAEFIDAFNTGDERRLDRVFAPPGDFLWFTAGDYTHWDRRTLVDYLERAHSAGERLQLRQLLYQLPGSTGRGGWRIDLIRTTNEGAAYYDGKGSCICYADGTDVIDIWGMGPRATTPGKPAVSTLVGSIGARRMITLRTGRGRPVARLPAGLYRITVRDGSRVDNFHLFGPQVDEQTGGRFRGTVRWMVQLHPGRYVYRSDRHKATRRSFIVEP